MLKKINLQKLDSLRDAASVEPSQGKILNHRADERGDSTKKNLAHFRHRDGHKCLYLHSSPPDLFLGKHLGHVLGSFFPKRLEAPPGLLEDA